MRGVTFSLIVDGCIYNKRHSCIHWNSILWTFWLTFMFVFKLFFLNKNMSFLCLKYECKFMYLIISCSKFGYKPAAVVEQDTRLVELSVFTTSCLLSRKALLNVRQKSIKELSGWDSAYLHAFKKMLLTYSCSPVLFLSNMIQWVFVEYDTMTDFLKLTDAPKGKTCLVVLSKTSIQPKCLIICL